MDYMLTQKDNLMSNNQKLKKVIKTYINIYDHRYNFEKNEVKHFEKNLNKNLKEIGLKNIKELSVLNAGTGLEALVLQKKKFKRIYLADINKKGINIINNLKKKNKRKYGNIFAKKLDFVKNDLIKNFPGISYDLAYFQGVCHHFSDPAEGITNIIRALNKNGVFFMRNYASGSLNFFMVDFVRKFIKFEDMKVFNQVFSVFFNMLIKKNFIIISQSDKSNAKKYFRTFCGDHLFVPYLFLYKVSDVDKFLRASGCIKIRNFETRNYFFKKKDLGNSNISFIYKKVKNVKSNNKIKLNHIDQMKDIKYKEKYILDLISLLNKKLLKIRKLSSKTRVNLAIKLLFLIDFKRYFFNYTKNKILIKNKKIFLNQKTYLVKFIIL